MSFPSNLVYTNGRPLQSTGIHRAFGELSGNPTVTRDSPTVLGWENRRVWKTPAPLWLPPASVADILAVSQWALNISYTAPSGFPIELNGAWEFSFSAGIDKAIVVAESGAETEFIQNAPGWTSITDAIIGKRNFNESTEEYESVAGLAKFRHSRFVYDEDEIGVYLLDVSVQIRSLYPAWYQEDDEADLDPHWVHDIVFSAEAFYSGVGDIGGPTGGVRTQILFYGEHEIGIVNASDPDADDAYEVTLADVDQFEAI